MYYDKRIETVPAPVQHPELSPVQQHCLEAAEYIREHGWCQGKWGDAWGRVCIMGALHKVLPEGEQFREYYNPAVNHLTQMLLGTCPVAFNDVPWRTKEEVIALLERAATGG